jgi:hypothetical protein
MSEAGSPVPFRWNRVTPDQLGALLSGTSTPDLRFLGDLLACAGKVLARSRNGDLIFVGTPTSCVSVLRGWRSKPTGIRPARREQSRGSRHWAEAAARWWRAR